MNLKCQDTAIQSVDAWQRAFALDLVSTFAVADPASGQLILPKEVLSLVAQFLAPDFDAVFITPSRLVFATAIPASRTATAGTSAELCFSYERQWPPFDVVDNDGGTADRAESRSVMRCAALDFLTAYSNHLDEGDWLPRSQWRELKLSLRAYIRAAGVASITDPCVFRIVYRAGADTVDYSADQFYILPHSTALPSASTAHSPDTVCVPIAITFARRRRVKPAAANGLSK